MSFDTIKRISTHAHDIAITTSTGNRVMVGLDPEYGHTQVWLNGVCLDGSDVDPEESRTAIDAMTGLDPKVVEELRCQVLQNEERNYLPEPKDYRDPDADDAGESGERMGLRGCRE